MKKDVAKTGYFAVMTHCMSPSQHNLAEILDVYGMHDEQEKRFTFIKSKGNAANERLFIQFATLIPNCLIYKKFIASSEIQKFFPTRQQILEKLRAIKLICHLLKARFIAKIIGLQVHVFKEFHLTVLAGCLFKKYRQKYAGVPEIKVRAKNSYKTQIVAVTGGQEPNGALNNDRCRMTGITCRRQLDILILHAAIPIQQFFIKKKTPFELIFSEHSINLSIDNLLARGNMVSG